MQRKSTSQAKRSVNLASGFSEESLVWLAGAGHAGNAAKCLTLVAVLYLLLLAAIRRGRMNLSREWTYRLEADLILGVVSTDTAISMIEHSRLGPRLQDVLDKHFTEIEEKYDAFERSIAEAASTIDDIRSIPEAYQAERKERARIAIDGPRKAFECVLKDSEDLTEFLKSAAMTMRVDSRVLAVIKKTIERSERNTERLRHAKERLFDLIKELYS